MADFLDRNRWPRALSVAVLGLSATSLLVLVIGPAFARDQSLEGQIVLHTLLEWSAVCLSLATAFLAFLYYRIRADVLVLTMGLAAFLSGLWDVLHTLESAALVPVPFALEETIPITWAASRTFRAAVVFCGALWALLQDRSSSPTRFAACVSVAATTCVALAASFLLDLTANGNLPAALRPDRLVHRPWDLPALVLFAVSGLVVLPIVLRKGANLLAQVLILSAVPEVVTQVLMVFGSRSLYDEAFVLAHVTKLIACAVPSTGILVVLTRAYRREMRSRGRMEELVSDLREIEEELRVKEAHLEQLTQGIREVFWISAPDGSKMHYVSPLYEEVFGLPVAPLYNRPSSFLDVVHPEDVEMMHELSVRQIDEDFEVDYRIARPDGTTRWLRTRGFPVRDDDGHVYRLAGVTEDVTEQKLAQEAVRVSEARMRALFSALPDLVYRANHKGFVLDFHGPHVDDAGGVVGKHLSEVLSVSADRVSTTLERTLASSRVQVLDYRAVVTGRPSHFEARFVRSAVDEVLVLVRDLTDQKNLEREILEVSQREQERIGSDLHDGIAQSLTGIALLSQVLLRELETAQRSEAVRAKQIAGLVEQTLARTRILARGLAPVELDEGGFSAALEEMASGVEQLYPVRCLCHCDESALVRDHEKAIHLFRIAQEAVTNALKHAKPSSIEISLVRRNGRFMMSIKDDGIGLDQSRIAGPGSSGGGMGLHIMRYRARMIDASLELAPADNKGTVVTCQWSAME